ncbi:hypothetical protein Scep_020277 [Stephania cephalantha]|uniref:Uncharacterized protein n=1 Tax=Stephania cephalantha TaxID=152367 RepID=A0AAP0ICW5_9MAGN
MKWIPWLTRRSLIGSRWLLAPPLADVSSSDWLEHTVCYSTHRATRISRQIVRHPITAKSVVGNGIANKKPVPNTLGNETLMVTVEFIMLTVDKSISSTHGYAAVYDNSICSTSSVSSGHDVKAGHGLYGHSVSMKMMTIDRWRRRVEKERRRNQGWLCGPFENGG